MLYLCAMHSTPFYGLYMGVMGMYGTLGIWTNRIRSIPDYTGLLGAPEGQLVQGAKWVRKALEPAEHECQDSQFCTKGSWLSTELSDQGQTVTGHFQNVPDFSVKPELQKDPSI